MKSKYLIKGIIRSIPLIKNLKNNKETTGGTCDARYCYSVWLRHLVLAFENGYNKIPKTAVELGPGDSIGIGLAALISGAEKYYGLDIIRFTNAEVNLQIFDDLVNLFRARTAIPNDEEFSEVKPFLKNYDFPFHILSNDYLNTTLDESRLQKIRASIAAMETPPSAGNDAIINYFVPYIDKLSDIPPASIDIIFSQSVLQHVENLKLLYKQFSTWLAPNGLTSHQIDFKSLNFAATWNGHWEYSDLEWKVVTAGKSYRINREPHSAYLNYLKSNNLTVITDQKAISNEDATQLKIATRFKNSPSEDFAIKGAFIQAIK